MSPSTWSYLRPSGQVYTPLPCSCHLQSRRRICAIRPSIHAFAMLLAIYKAFAVVLHRRRRICCHPAKYTRLCHVSCHLHLVAVVFATIRPSIHAFAMCLVIYKVAVVFAPSGQVYTPLPCILSSTKSPSYLPPSGQVYTPLPCILPSCHLHSRRRICDAIRPSIHAFAMLLAIYKVAVVFAHHP